MHTMLIAHDVLNSYCLAMTGSTGARAWSVWPNNNKETTPDRIEHVETH